MSYTALYELPVSILWHCIQTLKTFKIHLKCQLNSLAPGRSECDSKNVIFNLVSLIGIVRSSHDNALRWMPQDLTDNKSTLVQVMVCCRQATSHYLGRCWLSSLSPYGFARPQWVDWWVMGCSLWIFEVIYCCPYHLACCSPWQCLFKV